MDRRIERPVSRYCELVMGGECGNVECEGPGLSIVLR